MSPASSGSLEVEKYIGACLISQTRPKSGSRDQIFSRGAPNYVNFDGRFCVQRCNDRWAGGMPLISFANHQKRNRIRVDLERSLSPKQEEHNLTRLAVHTQGAPLILTKSFNNRRKVHKNLPRTPDNKTKASKSETSVGGVDAVSVTSDESSGNSDNCLPRIIKPRKRRKKDRKPNGLLSQDGFSTDSASPDIDNPGPFTPFIFDPHHMYGLVPENLPSLDDVSEAPKLHHNFEDVEEIVDINGNQSTTTCQCRYCDPSGQIWDVDTSCYSPFLTTPRFTDFFSTYNSSSSSEDCLVHGMSSICLEEKTPKTVAPSGDLEVSTEIVTSLNGHRDIEIKFFSASSVDSVRALAKGQDCASDVIVNNECKFVLSEIS